jgi:hypothetical protein
MYALYILDVWDIVTVAVPVRYMIVSLKNGKFIKQHTVGFLYS